ncbi:hypothetical protein NKR19_g6160 [Coniochaeta hoffmannii]|uniref:Copper acquisition factor BIM1-like domain-containing protein n=1 Tax=Coniochaeta hoffmannii TaxID=91930 RepID=A0AA38VEX8_9PEZI|nr:hypothetical protein NKR19_g6160 [Coniochaeta hoffmannii]
MQLLAVSLLLAAGVRAHFKLNFPASIGFDDDAQHDGPCGGFTPDFSKNNATDFFAGGDNVATLTTHSQGNWLYRLTVDPAASGNWTQIFAIVQQNGLGDFCEPLIAVPASLIGQKAVLGVVANTPDGILYQCAVVNLVSGTSAVRPECHNASSVAAQFSTDAALAALVGDGSDSNTTATGGSATHSHTEPTTTPTSTPNGNAGISLRSPQVALTAVLGVIIAGMVHGVLWD